MLHGHKRSLNILVTGGLGTIGAALIKMLRECNHRVISCDIYHQPGEISFSFDSEVKNPSYAKCDVGTFRQIERVFERMGPFDYVYHCAAEFGRWNGEDFYETLWHTNVIGTKNIIRLQEKLGFRLIHFSSSEVYGDWPNLMVETIMDEHEIKQLNDYAMTKWVNEMQLRNSSLWNRTETVVVRLFNVYGPGEYYSPYRSVNCRFLYCALHHIPWVVYRKHTRTSTYLDDVIKSLANIIDNFKPGETYNIGGDQPHTIEELSEVVIKVTGADRSLVEYKDSEPMTTKQKNADISKAFRDLGHKNTYSLENGMRLTAEWMRRAYRIA